MNQYTFGDVVLVPFLFTDQSASKQRPAIISSQRYNRQRVDLIVMAITSQIKPSSVFGEATIVNWKNAGLLKPSVVKPVIATIEQTLVRKQLGRLEEIDQAALHSALQVIIGDDD